MLTEFLLSLVPATGGIAYGVAAKIYHARGYDQAVAERKEEINKQVKNELRVGAVQFEHHLRGEPNHVCGEVCFAMMGIQAKMQQNRGKS